MMHHSVHLCFSGLPSCSGAAPCVVCLRFIQDKVIPRAMFLAGPPFNADANTAALFMRAYAQASRDGAAHALQHFQSQVVETEQAPQPGMVEEPTPLTEEQFLLLFKKSIIDGAKNMTPDHLKLMAKGVTECTLEGWQQLTEAEKNVLRQVFCPETPALVSVEIPEDEPLPSNESAIKVVQAMRQGTLSAQTLAPDLVTSAITEPPAVQAAEQAPGRSPPPTPPEGQPAGSSIVSEQAPTAENVVVKESITP